MATITLRWSMPMRRFPILSNAGFTFRHPAASRRERCTMMSGLGSIQGARFQLLLSSKELIGAQPNK